MLARMSHYQPPSDPYRPRFAGIATLMRMPHVPDATGLDIAMAGVPYDLGTWIRPGARTGPAQVREASRFIRTHHVATGVAPFELCQVADVGDAPIDPMDNTGSLAAMTEFFRGIAEAGAVPLVIGGDHTVPLLVLRGMRAGGGLPGKAALVQVDAHADVLQIGPGFAGDEVNHGTFARLAIEEGLVDPARSVQIGLRGSQYGAATNAFAADAGVRQIYQHEFDDLGPDGAVAEIRALAGDGPVYLTIDVDGLDPTACPGTGYPEPGGLTVRELQRLLRGMRGLDVVGADVCEVAPALDPSGGTALVAANLAFEELCLLAESVVRRRGTGG
jgi:guanidinopropionase